MMPLPMVGREEELAEIHLAWSQLRAAPAGRARTVLVTGAAGCGKSLLVSAALDALDPAPATTLFGWARIHTPAPYDWLAAALGTHSTADLPVPADAVAWLAQLPGRPVQRYAPGALLRIAVRTVKAVVDCGPAVIVVEDLHALDPASLNLIGELAYAPGLRALLLVTSRPPEDELVARTLAQLTGAAGAIRQHLGPLAPTEVAVVLERAYQEPVPASIAAAVHGRTGGNPYRLTELLAACRGGGLPSLGAAVGVLAEAPVDYRPDLTAREIEVLACLAAGMSNKQVARSLGISIRTVAVHVSNLLRKTRSSSRTEAALWAVRHELAGVPQSS